MQAFKQLGAVTATSPGAIVTACAATAMNRATAAAAILMRSCTLRSAMTPKQEIEKLRGELERHNRLYYLEAKPEISDYDFDQLLRRLQEQEEKHPQHFVPNSPSQRVGEFGSKC